MNICESASICKQACPGRRPHQPNKLEGKLCRNTKGIFGSKISVPIPESDLKKQLQFAVRQRRCMADFTVTVNGKCGKLKGSVDCNIGNCPIK